MQNGTAPGEPSRAAASETKDRFYEPMLKSPYEYPRHHWELDESNRPTNRIVDSRRPSAYLSPSTNGIVEGHPADRPITAVLDAYNPEGSTRHARFTTPKTTRCETSEKWCHVNSAVCDGTWQVEFCRVAETHPRVRASVKNQNLGLEVPYRYGSETRRYIPDFVLLVDDGRGPDDPLHLVVEVKGYRREDAKVKATTMKTYWIPSVNRPQTYRRRAFRQFTDVYEMETDFGAAVAVRIDETIGLMLDA